MSEFKARGVRVVALSVDPPEATRQLCESQGYNYTFLADIEREVIRRFDLLHPGGGGPAGDIARPAEFLIDPAGRIHWVNLTEDYRIRPRPEQVLEIVDGILARTKSSTGR